MGTVTAARSVGRTRAAPLTCTLDAQLDAAAEAALDAFVLGCPYPTQQQRPLWRRVAPLSRLQDLRYLRCEDEDGLFLTGVVRCTRLFAGRFLAVFQRGPSFRDPADLDRALPEIKATLRRAGACTVMMNPRWEDEGAERVAAVLATHGFAPMPFSEVSTHTATGLVDLRPDEADVFATFKSRGRTDIRKAERKGIIVRPVQTDHDAEALRQMREQLSRHKGLDDAGQPDVVDQWRLQVDGLEAGVSLLAEVDGAPVSGLVVGCEGARGIIRGGGALPHPTKLPREAPLFWEAMRRLKALGCTEFDVAGMPDPRSSEPVDEGERRREHFKNTFKPRLALLVPPHVAPLQPVSHAVLFRARQRYRRSPLKRIVRPLLGR